MCNETVTNPKNENLALQDEIKCLNTYASLNELASFNVPICDRCKDRMSLHHLLLHIKIFMLPMF